MPVLPSYRNLSIDLLWKSMDWFLYEGNTTNFERIHFIHVVFCFKLWTLNLLLSSNLSLFRWILYKILVTNIRFCVSVFVFDTQQHFREILNLTLNFTRLLFFFYNYLFCRTFTSETGSLKCRWIIHLTYMRSWKVALEMFSWI